MSRIVWGSPSERFFETGLDRGVLYVGNNPGVPWNGLVSVNESSVGGEARPAYIDGYKFRNTASPEEFEATIEAFSAPKEFSVCDGLASGLNGLFAAQQPRKTFGMSYRTQIGNGLRGLDFGYKIHLIYNALVTPSARSQTTMNETGDAMILSWGITTRPPRVSALKPTAHYIIDSRETPPGLRNLVEDILYGTNDANPRLPLPDELVLLFSNYGGVDGGTAQTTPTLFIDGGTASTTNTETINGGSSG